MEQTLCFCKIAIETDGFEGVSDEKLDNVFRYEEIVWKPLPYITLDCVSIQSLLETITLTSSYFYIDIRKEHQQLDAVPVNDNESKLQRRYMAVELYDALSKQHADCTETTLNYPLNLPNCFKPQLYKYQERSVRWLLHRENTPSYLPNLYYKLEPKCAENTVSVYKHACCMRLLLEEPAPIPLATGGILADEMGLGKTVEMMALILLNKRKHINSFIDNTEYSPAKRARIEQIIFCICNPSHAPKQNNSSELIQCTKCGLYQHQECVLKNKNAITEALDSNSEPYYCPICWKEITKDNLYEVGTTFIVSPNMIKKQWLFEFKRHTHPMLKVLLYEGVYNHQWVSPQTLAKYDVVLTDYNVLRTEIYHSSKFETERMTRNKPLSMKIYTPLLMVNWWRVCLDEAQMVESNSSNSANLVRMLPAVHRWAVTGTPIHRSIDDLQSLLRFISVHELQNSEVWNNLINDFVVNHKVADKRILLIEILQKCMWRTSKASVDCELKLPPQKELMHRITLSKLEALFYSEQHAECKEDFQHKLEKYKNKDTKLRTISPQVLKNILHPLLRIRQTCIMSVVEDKQKNSVNKQFLHPTQLYKHLLSSNESACKTQLRSIASALNGIAGLFYLKEDYEQAIFHYELVLKLAADYNQKNISVDKLLQIHALHNILEAYAVCPDLATAKCFNAESYEKRLYALESKYLQNYIQVMQQEQNQLVEVREKYDLIMGVLRYPLLEFIAQYSSDINEDCNEFQALLIDKIQTECFGQNSKLDTMHNINGVLMVITVWYDKVEMALGELDIMYERLKFFYDEIIKNSGNKKSATTDAFIKSVYHCHLREVRESQPETRLNNFINDKESKRTKCVLCVMDKKLKTLQKLLYIEGNDNGLEIPSFEVCVLNVIFNLVKSKSKNEHYLNDVKQHKYLTTLISVMTKNYNRFWIELEYTVKAFDELDMCKMRISLTNELSECNNYRILIDDVDPLMLSQRSCLLEAENEFAKKLGRLRYIKHLEQNIDQLPCPICHVEDAVRFTVLECGHHMCLDCMKSVNQYYKASTTRITCPVCRYEQKSNNIYYVTRLAVQHNVTFQGTYSSKITYIVGLVLKLLTDEPEVKILIFSQWQPILSAISEALNENNVTNINQCTPEAIGKFKNPNFGVTCLLMPLSKGSKGLNIIEATQVFLVEPILDPGEELQAIGRVHRFGQTKETTVHRFIVNNTIEENIYNVIVNNKSNSRNWNLKNMTLATLEGLF